MKLAPGVDTLRFRNESAEMARLTCHATAWHLLNTFAEDRFLQSPLSFLAMPSPLDMLSWLPLSHADLWDKLHIFSFPSPKR